MKGVRRMASALATLFAMCLSVAPAPAQEVELPRVEGSLKFAVFGDSGTGGTKQYQTADMMASVHTAFPFELVLMLGDNLYGSERRKDHEKKFEQPYRELLRRGVRFYASLGNHDEIEQIDYPLFHMGGRRFYSFRPEGYDVRFFALHSDYLDEAQLAWLEEELATSTERWKICFFHHPIYSSGRRHGPDLPLREELEPMFVRTEWTSSFPDMSTSMSAWRRSRGSSISSPERRVSSAGGTYSDRPLPPRASTRIRASCWSKSKEA